MILSPRSLSILSTVHPDMQRLVRAVALQSSLQIVVMQGLRTAAQEMELWLSCHDKDGTRNDQPWKTNCNGYPVGVTALNGVKGTGVSRHQTGHAVDLGVEINSKMVWDLPHYHQIDNLMQTQAVKLGIPIIYGGNFSTPDPDHWQLNPAFYPEGT